MPGLLSDSELAELQADAVDVACDQPCQIQRVMATVPDGAGQLTPALLTIATTVAGITQPTGTHLQNYDYLIGAMKAWEVRFPVGTDVRGKDTLLIAGKALTVQVVLTPRSYPV